jgi:hypothetical protein
MRLTIPFLIVALKMLSASANAAVVVNDTTDINLSIFVPCALGGVGEIIDISGPLHTLISITINGNSVSGYFHFQPQGISGTGETTGDKYDGTGPTSRASRVLCRMGRRTSLM